jgi:hypothetical protein
MSCFRRAGALLVIAALAIGLTITTAAACPPPRSTPLAVAEDLQAAEAGDSTVSRGADLDRTFLLGPFRWSRCQIVPVRVVGGATILRATSVAVARVRRASGLRLRLQSEPLPDGRGIRVRAHVLRARYTLGETDLFSLGGELWRADSDIDVAKTGPDRLNTVIQHELGHALGIRHSPRSVGDVMSPIVRRGALPFSTWDRAAFAYAGHGKCSPPA